MNTYTGEIQAPRIRVIGTGGGGCNAVERMVTCGIEHVEFIAINTDAQSLSFSSVDTCLTIGNQTTRGLGSGGNPIVGQQAAEESQAQLSELLKGTDLLFIAAGMGGGTGTGAAPIIANIARELGILTVGVVTRPFTFEGRHRQRIAEQGITQLRGVVDTLLVIPNDRLLSQAQRTTSLRDSFTIADSVLRQGVQGITDIILRPGIINVDFNDVKAIIAQAGPALMGVGVGVGPNSSKIALNQALNSPLLEVGLAGARRVLVNITGNEKLSLLEVHEIMAEVQSVADEEANIIFGAVVEASFPADMIQVTIVAAGFEAPCTSSERISSPSTISRNPVVLNERKPLPLRAYVPVVSEATRTTAPTPRQGAIQIPAVQSYEELDMPPFLRKRVRA